MPSERSGQPCPPRHLTCRTSFHICGASSLAAHRIRSLHSRQDARIRRHTGEVRLPDCVVGHELEPPLLWSPLEAPSDTSKGLMPHRTSTPPAGCPTHGRPWCTRSSTGESHWANLTLTKTCRRLAWRWYFARSRSTSLNRSPFVHSAAMPAVAFVDRALHLHGNICTAAAPLFCMLKNPSADFRPDIRRRRVWLQKRLDWPLQGAPARLSRRSPRALADRFCCVHCRWGARTCSIISIQSVAQHASRPRKWPQQHHIALRRSKRSR